MLCAGSEACEGITLETSPPSFTGKGHLSGLDAIQVVLKTNTTRMQPCTTSWGGSDDSQPAPAITEAPTSEVILVAKPDSPASPEQPVQLSGRKGALTPVGRIISAQGDVKPAQGQGRRMLRA